MELCERTNIDAGKQTLMQESEAMRNSSGNQLYILELTKTDAQ
jgi:hypothetical protein